MIQGAEEYLGKNVHFLQKSFKQPLFGAFLRSLHQSRLTKTAPYNKNFDFFAFLFRENPFFYVVFDAFIFAYFINFSPNKFIILI